MSQGPATAATSLENAIFKQKSLGAPLKRLESSSVPNLLDLESESEDIVHTPLTRANSLPKSPQKALVRAFELEGSKLLRFREWMACICIVQFDVDYGPKIEFITPANLTLPQSERDNIAFSAFPDTSNPNSGTQVHSFRIRSTFSPASTDDDTEEKPLLVTADGFLYGYCAFTQQRDRTLKRGYLQRSLVFLSQHPLPALFSSILAIAIDLFLKHDYETLETACHNISNWPSPRAASTLELGFLASVLHVELPQHIDQQQLIDTSSFGETFDPSRHILAAYPPLEITAVEIFSAVLPSLWSLWECIVLSEPVFLHAASPALASTAIWWLRDWLRPIPLSGDFRPYFTIHDPDHKRLVNKGPAQPGVMIGTTNPFLYEECKHWPHIVGIGAGASGRPSGSKVPVSSPGPPPGFKTSHKRYISKDRPLLKELENALRAGVSRNERLHVSNLLRKHFAERANGLMVPLNRYLTSLIPTPNSSPLIPGQVPETRGTTTATSGRLLRAPPRSQRMAPFNATDMLASLQRYGSPVPFKSTAKRREFYERWLRTNAFSAWLMREEEIVMRVLAERNSVATS